MDIQIIYMTAETNTDYGGLAGYILVLINSNILLSNWKRLQYLFSNPVSLSVDFQNCWCQHYKCQSLSLSDGGKPPGVWRRPRLVTFLLALFTTMSLVTHFFFYCQTNLSQKILNTFGATFQLLVCEGYIQYKHRHAKYSPVNIWQ